MVKELSNAQRVDIYCVAQSKHWATICAMADYVIEGMAKEVLAATTDEHMVLRNRQAQAAREFWLRLRTTLEEVRLPGQKSIAAEQFEIVPQINHGEGR